MPRRIETITVTAEQEERLKAFLEKDATSEDYNGAHEGLTAILGSSEHPAFKVITKYMGNRDEERATKEIDEAVAFDVCSVFYAPH
jgi:hypothetical protein